MKILVVCEQCQILTPDAPLDFKFIPVTNDNNYEYKCQKGHTFRVLLEIPFHEVLFEYGLTAIVDGYYRESVSAVVASLEKYYELSVEVIQMGNGIKDGEIEKLIKKLNRSELKLGAYISSYVQKYGTVPKTLSDQEIHFRNDVIHNGKFPTKEEAVEWAKKTYLLIKPECEKLRKELKNEYLRTTRKEYMRNLSKKSEAAVLRPLKLGTVLSEMIPFKGPQDISDYLQTITQKREIPEDSYIHWNGRPF